MCNQQIKIDRSSIERNPNGGRTSINKPLGRVVYKFKINLKPEYLKYDQLDSFDSVGNCEGYTCDEELVKKLVAEGAHIECEQRYQQFNFMTPQPLYFFKYENTTLTCPECGEETEYEKLRCDTVIDSEGEEHNVYDACPNCGEVIELDYEKIENVINE